MSIVVDWVLEYKSWKGSAPPWTPHEFNFFATEGLSQSKIVAVGHRPSIVLSFVYVSVGWGLAVEDMWIDDDNGNEVTECPTCADEEPV